MNSAVLAFRHGRVEGALGTANGLEDRGEGSASGCVIVAWIRNVLLRDGREVDDGVGDGVSASEGKDDAWVGGAMGEDNVAA